jgi:ParB/RepB/Spo0J family partition protein
MSELKTPTVPISMIDVDPDSNVRTHIDQKKLKGLASTVEAIGVRQPIEVRLKENGRFDLVAGERRYLAAQLAGLDEVPITVGEGNAHLSKVIENFQREGLDPIDTARALRMLKGELNLKTIKQLADRTGMEAGWIGDHLRLLNLPKGVQRYFAEGEVPIEGERLLRDIALVSPRIAECICEMAKRQDYKGRQFVIRFGDIFAATAEARFNNKPTMIPARAVPVSAVAKGKKRDELVERIHAISPYYKPKDPTLRFEDAEVDAARAAGCLVEHRAGSTTAFITDAAVAADLFGLALERAEEKAKKRAEEEAAWRGRSKELGSSDKDEHANRRAEAKAKKEIAEDHNDELARKQLLARTGARRKQHGLARSKAIALLFIEANPNLAGRGLRLTLPGLRELEVKELKSGKERKKVIYADAEQCTAELIRRVNSASTEAQVNEVLAEAIVAAKPCQTREASPPVGGIALQLLQAAGSRDGGGEKAR